MQKLINCDTQMHKQINEDINEKDFVSKTPLRKINGEYKTAQILQQIVQMYKKEFLQVSKKRYY